MYFTVFNTDGKLDACVALFTTACWQMVAKIVCAAVVFELLGIVSLYSVFVTFWLLFGKCFLISHQSEL